MRAIYHHNAIKKSTKPSYAHKPQDAESMKKKIKVNLIKLKNRLQLLRLHDKAL